ncbi:polyamine aminopropyltransferase [Paenactinomyces guangxiensis]|uniref:Polyamine aminopropyltransferase n=1 Tax=Paenactinomyces guangxiensis TaxID=1490290 RepID=A0A7W1WQ81_9BACL|nr:polyamine aminopropyltransferase [Paenactinomyces guangxiensis]MBA4494067.1 polyamine aminopropyltransferase [Paenactinomyces guangxiensis]MBH8591188.1 polyamine aminopropyltransferase [Paenactinomyces guangxiensis]
MELWYTEKQTKNHGITTKIKRSVYHDQSEFQTLDIIETAEFGNMLVLDGMVMTTDRDEFVYHEMITHVAMNTHPNPKDVLVVGGGDGGAIREILRYPSVANAVLAEIDGKVIEASQKYFPKIASGLSDPRVNIQVTDGIRHIQENKGTYDVILVDSTEPVGPAVGLFQKPFYEGIYEALKEDGIMVAQTESPWFNQDLIRQVFKDISNTFPITRLYTASIPTYPSGLWSFTVGSKKYDPLQVDESGLQSFDTRYYRPEMHKALFQLPAFVQELLTDKGE